MPASGGVPGKAVLAVVLMLLVPMACRTAEHKRLEILGERARKLKPLSRFEPVTCRLEVRLTQPAQARYREMFGPKAGAADPLLFQWKAREASCEVKPMQDSALARNYRGFLEASLCLLLHVHWVNSPFDELAYEPQRLSQKEGWIHVPTSPDGALGLYLDEKDFVIETRTKSHGLLRASYAEVGGEWLPRELNQRSGGGTQVSAEEFEWSSERVGGRRMPHSFWTYAGEDKPFRHSQVQFGNCIPL